MFPLLFFGSILGKTIINVLSDETLALNTDKNIKIQKKKHLHITKNVLFYANLSKHLWYFILSEHVHVKCIQKTKEKHIFETKLSTKSVQGDLSFVFSKICHFFLANKQKQRTCTEPCRSAGVRFPKVAPDF